MAGAKISLSPTTGELKDDGNGNALMVLPRTLAQLGFAALATEIHDGASGAARLVRRVTGSLNSRLRVAIDSPVFEEWFHHGVLNTRKYAQLATTQTVAVGGGFLTLNNSGITTTATGSLERTYKSFPLYGPFETELNFWFSIPFTPVTNNTFEMGIGIVGASAIVAPVDGIYMQVDSAGALQLIANYNGSITTTGALTFTWTTNKVYNATIKIGRNRSELYIDGVLLGSIDRPSGSTGMALNQSGHMFARCHHTGTVASAQKLAIAAWSVSQNDSNIQRPISLIRTGAGDHLLSTPDGTAVGQLANYTNSAAPASATLSNTAAGYTTLGGQFQFAAVTGAETDYALFAYQNPVGTASLPGRNLIITGIDIDTMNTGAAVATTETWLQWSIAGGSTAVSLATGDTATTKGPHRLTLGNQVFPIAAAIGAQAVVISRSFPEGITIHPGEFFHITVKVPRGTATASQIIRGVAGVKGFFD